MAEKGEKGVAPLIVHQFRPAWDIQAYMRFASITYHIENSQYPVYASTGPLPQLQHGKALVGWRKSIRYLKKLSHKDLDEDLCREDQADCVAFCTMIQTTLHNVLMYSYWADNKRYSTATKPVMQRAMVSPLRWFVPDTLRKKYVQHLEEDGMADLLTVRHDALACYRALDTKLGDKRFLFGTHPTSADAMLYGHLAAAQQEICGPWLSKFKNLKRFYQYVSQRYFSDAVAGVGYLCTKGVNLFEEHAAEEAKKARKKKRTGGDDEADPAAARWWRLGVITLAVGIVGSSLLLSRRR